jgi:hypothetical protein
MNIDTVELSNKAEEMCDEVGEYIIAICNFYERVFNHDLTPDSMNELIEIELVKAKKFVDANFIKKEEMVTPKPYMGTWFEYEDNEDWDE